jgi:PKHD-type hydroxylase
MSNYQFTPSPTFGVSEHNFATWEDGFSFEEIQEVIKIGESLDPKSATVTGGSIDGVRESQVSWISLTQDTVWLYDKLAYIARSLNGQFFKFDLYGFSEDLQFTVYHGQDQGFYEWHLDRGPNSNGTGPRKLSMVLQLSDPYEYEGGELQLKINNEELIVPKQRGLVVCFPSFMLHRVTPVTSGIRRSLVVWITGPAFR